MSSMGKHFAGAEKHSTSSNFKNINKRNIQKKIVKFLLLIIIILIIAIIAFFTYSYFVKKMSGTLTSASEISEEEQYIYSEKVEVSKNTSVKGAEYLEITGVYINSDNPKLSTVSARLKNTSDKSYENIKLRITLYDENNNQITTLDYKIAKIEANGEAITHATLKRDLSNCKDYAITLQEPKK